MISPENRAEFEQLRVHEVRKRVDGITYSPEKHNEAIEWLEEQDPAREAVSLARAAGTRATIALVISGLALVVTVVFGIASCGQ